METYLKRTYRQRAAKASLMSETPTDPNFPFWDYRSRRGSLSTSGTSSSGASSYDGCSVASLSSIRSADTASDRSSLSGSDSDSVMFTADPHKLQLQFMVDAHEVLPLYDLYKPVTDWVDQDIDVFRVNEKQQDDVCNQSLAQPKRMSRMPSLAVMIFLAEDGPLGYERIQGAKRRFEKPPWRFHHSEHMAQGKLNLYPYNSPDYFYTSEELPLWAVRLVHCGKEFVRVVLFTSQENWDDMVQFYRLVIGFEPDSNKDDFCLFTIHTHGHYNIQFALKKLKGETSPRVLDSVKLQFRVPEVGSLVPLFPNVCKPISDKLWETKDHDGNVIVIDVVGKPRPKASTPSKDPSKSSSRTSYSSRNSLSSISSEKSSKSVQSLTSVTSSLSSSTSSSSGTSSMTSVSSALTDLMETVKEVTNIGNHELSEDVRVEEEEEDIPPKLPPRIPRTRRVPPPPQLPERPVQCFAGLRGFYV